MFRPVTQITINQVTAGRSSTISLDFVSNFTASDDWADLTDKAKIVFPKSVYCRDENNRLVSLDGTNKSIGGFDSETPLFMRGDKVSISFGYLYFDKLGNEIRDVSEIFQGYISKVGSKKPIEIECEDNMWILKQIQAPNKVFPASSYTWEKILEELIKGTGFTVNALTSTKIGDFRTQGETVCQVIERVRKDYHLEAYFRGSELRCGSKVYIETDAVQNTFAFQQNIISDDLTYKRKDDVVLSAVCYSVNKLELQGTTKTGKKKKGTKRLEVLVYVENGVFKYIKKTQGKDFPVNVQGERRTLYFWDISNETELFEKGVEELKKFYYTGLTGKFTTFGIPFVKMGDNVDIVDPVLPERNGLYKVRAVEYEGGTGGHRQTISLDYLISQT